MRKFALLNNGLRYGILCHDFSCDMGAVGRVSLIINRQIERETKRLMSVLREGSL